MLKSDKKDNQSDIIQIKGVNKYNFFKIKCEI